MFSLEGVGYEVGGRELFNEVSLAINKGDKIGLVGKNGVGKTSLLRIISGNVQPTVGEVYRGGCEVGLMPQNLQQWFDKSVHDFVEYVTGVAAAREEFENSCQLLETRTDDAALVIYADSLEKFTRLDVADFENNLEKALTVAELTDIDTSKPLGDFSGGQRTRIGLAATFASRHDIILLDEPTNNLDTRGVEVLEQFIDSSNAAFVVVSHDRRFLRTATSRIVELLGDGRGVQQFGTGYDEYIQSRNMAKEAATKRYDQYETEKKRIQQAAKQAKIRANSASSHKPHGSDNDKLNANFRREKAASGFGRAAQSLTSRVNQLQEPERPIEDISLNFMFKEVDKKKSSLLTVRELSVEYPDGKKLGPLSLHIQNGDRIVLEGANGTGKSSLLKAIVGQSQGVVMGDVSIGKEAKIAYIDQNQSLPFMEMPAYENLRYLAPHLEAHEVINLLVRFNLNRDAIRTTPTEKLSGGERAKVLLASIAANKPNLLILDEPTNNLDIVTVEALEAALATYNGAVLAVSHDRDFLDTIHPTGTVQVTL